MSANYSARGIFVNINPDPVVAQQMLNQLRATAVALIMEGKTIMTYTDGVTNVTKNFSMSPDDVLIEVNYAEQRLHGRVRALVTNYNRIVDR
mgnify:CR=1 FL=1